MPNLVHSLDSPSLLLVFNSLKELKNDRNYLNFYSVLRSGEARLRTKACFAVTANDVDLLIDVIRKIYIDLYSENKYIDTFDDDTIEIFIKALGGKDNIIYIEDTREIKSKKSSFSFASRRLKLNFLENLLIQM